MHWPWRNHSLLLSILTGIMVGTSYIPFPPWALMFAMVPLWSVWLKSESLKMVWWSGWLAQFTLTLIGFNWVAYTAHEFGHVPWPLALVALVLYCSFASLHVPISGVLWWWLFGRRGTKRPVLPRALGLAGTLILAEIYYPMIFDWNLGYPWMQTTTPIPHLAEWIGFQGLSALTIITNALVLVFVSQQTPRPVRLASGAGLVGLWAAVLGLGLHLYRRLPPPDRAIEVGIVQANIGNLEKQEAEKGPQFRDTIVSTYLRLTQQLLDAEAPPNLIVWPETAVPDFLDEGFIDRLPQARRVQEFVRSAGVPLITGAYSFNLNTQKVANAMFALGTDGRPVDERYAKVHLLAFGEYLPGSDWLPWIKKYFPATADFERGEGAKIFELGGMKLGPQICYEGLFPGLSKDMAKLGAQVLVNVTNDSWYGPWQEPKQHMFMTLARALELRLPLIRSTNTGISTVVLASGRILQMSPVDQEWIGRFTVPLHSAPEPTLFVRGGHLFAGLVGLLLTGLSWAMGLARTRAESVS